MKAQSLLAAALFTVIGLSLSDPVPGGEKADDGAYDFIFLAEARPILIRVHPHVNGEPVKKAWNEVMDHLFRYLDVNADRVLSTEEVERAPPLDQILGGGLGSVGGVGLMSGMSKAPALPTMKDFDTNNDGKVSLAELSAYYRKQGFVPFQLEAEKKAADDGYGGMAMMMMGGGNLEPTNEAIGDAIFKLLDADHDGKLTKAELAAAPEILLRHDANEEEIVTAKQLFPSPRPRKDDGGTFGLGGMFGKGAPPPKATAAHIKLLLAVPVRGQVPAELTERMQARYAPKEETKTLDAAEVVKRAPDLEVVVRLGKSADAKGRLEVLKPEAGKIKTLPGLAFLDLGATRTELRAAEGSQDNALSNIVRQQVAVQFKLVDRENKGYVTAESVAGNPQFARAFKAMDRDGDGKVTEQEFNAYLDLLQDLQARATLACVSLVVADQSRGLFDLLDVNRDGRLCVRAMSSAPALLEKYDLGRKGYITSADLPHSYRLTVRRGPTSDADPLSALLVKVYRLGAESDDAYVPTAGPAWFRKMDRNRDGDVSRREWLGSEELFRRIDADGDGLISAEEAQRYDDELRKRK
jgi:Ca2+-binding EF-hand superfamily protein